MRNSGKYTQEKVKLTSMQARANASKTDQIDIYIDIDIGTLQSQ